MRKATAEPLFCDGLTKLRTTARHCKSSDHMPPPVRLQLTVWHLQHPSRAVLDLVQAAGHSLAVQDLQLCCGALQARVQGAPVGTPVSHQALVAVQTLQPQVLHCGGAAAQGEMPQARP